MNLELKQYIYDFNYLISRINKAESIPGETLMQYSEEGYMKLITALQDIIRQVGELKTKIERITGRELTDYEKLNGINIKEVFSWKLKI